MAKTDEVTGLTFVPIRDLWGMHPVFRKISLDAAGCLMTNGRLILLDNDLLFEKGAPHQKKLYLILYGWAVYTCGETLNKVRFGPGSFVGTEWVYEEGAVRANACEVYGEAAVLEIDYKSFNETRHHLELSNLTKDVQTLESQIKRAYLISLKLLS